MKLASWAGLSLLLCGPIALVEAAPGEGPKTVLVTGASTGIGRKITERLAADGHFVYAGARKEKDFAELNAIENVQAIWLDVTKPEEIAAAERSGQVSRLTDRSKYKSPDEVADAVALALFEASPRRRYLVVPNGYEGEIAIRKAIQELVQLNEGHAYTYDRDALVKMLDEALATARPAVPVTMERAAP